jgi:hypothetical protein
MLVANSGFTLGLGTWGCLGCSSRGACFGKSAYRGRQRKVGMGSRGPTVGNLFAEDNKGKAGMGGYLHMGLLSWPWTHFMA